MVKLLLILILILFGGIIFGGVGMFFSINSIFKYYTNESFIKRLIETNKTGSLISDLSKWLKETNRSLYEMFCTYIAFIEIASLLIFIMLFVVLFELI